MQVSPMLSVERVSKSFQQVRAVDEIEFEVRRGEVFGFLGPNGAGKTTTLRMIMGITRPDSGTLRFEGLPEVDRRRVGYLPEERGLFDDAGILDTLVYLGTLRGLSRGGARAQGLHWLGRLNLADRAGAKLGTLSKGNQQKVQLAGALLHQPDLVVLDEPFSGLDPLNQEMVLGLIRELRDQDVAVLLSAHQLDLVQRLCDRFLLISRGRRVVSGTLEEMRRSVLGNAADILALDLRLTGPGPDPERLAAGLIAAAMPGAEPRVRSASADRVGVEIPLPAGANLSPVLAAVSARFAVERVHMRPLPLHEIYLRAVGEAGGDEAAGTDPSEPLSQSLARSEPEGETHE